jgi:Ala-tRNA(Pro) deacylase
MNLYEILSKLEITYYEVEHEAVYTIEEANQIESKIDGVGSKNLFLKDKGSNYYIYVLREDKRADLKELAKFLNVSKLSFGKDEELKRVLDLDKGGVTPLAIINDEENKVTVIIDKDLEGKKVLHHPNVINKTMSIEHNDLIKIIEYTEHKYFIY